MRGKKRRHDKKERKQENQGRNRTLRPARRDTFGIAVEEKKQVVHNLRQEYVSDPDCFRFIS